MRCHYRDHAGHGGLGSIERGELHTPFGSWHVGATATAWDVAWPAVFLASDESRWITGATLPVDAGTTSATAFGLSLLNQWFPE